MDKKGIKPLIPFLKRIERKFRPEKVILFGSRARGDFHPESDYDLLIIADEFEGINPHERMVSAYHLKRNVPVPVDVLCLTPREFMVRKKRIGTIQEAAEEGIEITAG